MTEEKIRDSIECECGSKGCDRGLIIGKYPGDKIKIQVFDKENILTVVINKKKLMEELEKVLK